jgi:hypothetical protein
MKSIIYNKGDKIGDFTVIEMVKDIHSGKYLVRATCRCGKERLAQQSVLKIQKGCVSCRFGNFPGRIVSGCTLIKKIDQARWEIKCRCGNIYINSVRIDRRNSGDKFRDCGCSKDKIIWEKAKEKIGYKFGKLKVISLKKGDKHIILVCKCKCGNKIEIFNGHESKQNSCGCLKKENVPKAEKKSNAKLSNIDVISLREMYASNLYSLKDLSIIFNTDAHYILRIVKGYIWKSLPNPISNLKPRPRPICGPYKPRNKNP